MSEDMLVQHCSPTLAGIKTGNMFSCEFANDVEMRNCVCRWNHIFVKKGLRVLPLRFRDNRALVYVYRPSRLSLDLQSSAVYRILKERGYKNYTPQSCISELIKRLREREEFPHEIGLFLGYPPEDVQGFIEHRAADCKCVGCWKVYGDENTAKKLFAKYKKCKDIYCTLFSKGKSIEWLTVAV